MSEGRSIVDRKSFDRSFVELGTVLQHDEGERQRALDFVWDRHNRSLVHAGHPLDQLLNFARPDIFAADHEHVVSAAEEMEKPVLVPAHNVSGSIPAVAHHFAGLFRLVVVAFHQHRALHVKHALVRGRTFPKLNQRAGHRITQRRVRPRQPVGMRTEHPRSGLGGAVSVADRRTRKHSLHLLDQRLGQRRRTHHHLGHGGDVDGFEQFALARQHRHHGRHRCQPGHPILGDRLGKESRIEGRQQHH